MNAKHTPGPWELDDCQTFVYALNNQSVPINRMWFKIYGGWTDAPGVQTPLQELQANAHLIAAAPDLLAKLESLRTNGGFCDIAELENVDALIAKAKGQQP